MTTRTLAIMLAALVGLAATAATRAGNAGRSTVTPGFYDCNMLNLLHKDFGDKPAASLLAHDKSVNHIYEAPGFIDVVDAIPADGFNGIWQEVHINFVSVAPHQYCKDDDILGDAAAGRITLDYTTDVEICVVVGPHAH